MAASHRQTIKINASFGQILTVLRGSAFCSKLNLELKSENPTDSGVWFRFHHGTTFSSWGEKITITLTPVSQSQTNVDVHSECGMPTQIIDWGKNRQNVCNILEHIEAAAPKAEESSSHINISAPKDTKYCFNCGKQIKADSKFCCFCGQKQN